MFTELIGVPGCGKSTFVAGQSAWNPLERYLYRSSRLLQNIRKCLLTAYFFAAQPGESFSLLKKFRAIRFAAFSKKLKMFLYLYSVLGALRKGRRHSDGRDLIADEGVNQVVWGFLYNAPASRGEIARLHHALVPYFADEIILLEVSPDVIRERLLRREQSGGAELKYDLERDETALERAFACLETLTELLRGEGKAMIVRKNE